MKSPYTNRERIEQELAAPGRPEDLEPYFLDFAQYSAKGMSFQQWLDKFEDDDGNEDRI